VNPSPSRTPFAWVQKRDGRIVPFDADKISRALFAATESLGRPDAFVARELTDGVLHFLANETHDTTPSTSQIAELVVKVVRELGQPALARQFERAGSIKSEKPAVAHSAALLEEGAQDQQPPLVTGVERAGSSIEDIQGWIDESTPDAELRRRIAVAELAAFSLEKVFSRDLASAHRDGLLTLTGLEAPLALASYVLPFQKVQITAGRPDFNPLIDLLDEARSLAGGTIVFDGPEYALLLSGTGRSAAADFVRALSLANRITQLPIILNLNCRTPPPWAEGLGGGPLFTSLERTIYPEDRAALATSIMENVISTPGWSHGTRIDLHLAAEDLDPDNHRKLAQFARQAQRSVPVMLVFDRPKRPIQLAEGIDRPNQATLLAIGLHLPRLAKQLGESRDIDLLLSKLGSLVRMALSAAAQKRESLKKYLRATTALNRGFLVDRARTVIVPVGLEAITRSFCGRSLCASASALGFAKRVLERLQEAIEQDGPSYLLDACLDSWSMPSVTLGGGGTVRWAEEDMQGQFLSALSPSDRTSLPREQLRAAGEIHVTVGRGTATILLPSDQPFEPGQLVDLLQFAWQRTDCGRLVFTTEDKGTRQHVVPWENPDSR
jgi:hypothetical protein